MENKNKNGFLFIWGSCIVFLLVLCFFGISDSMKGTYAANTSYTCPTGYKDCSKNGLSGCECYKSEAATAKPATVGGYCTCQSVQTGVGSCTCETVSGITYGGTCSGSSCNCGSGGTVFKNSCHGAPQIVSGSCVQSGSSAVCNCGTNNVASDNCIYNERSYGCKDGWTQSGSMCYLYANYIKTQEECTTGSYFASEGEANIGALNACRAQSKSLSDVTKVSGTASCYTWSCCECSGPDCPSDTKYWGCWCNGNNCSWGSHSNSEEGWVFDSTKEKCPPIKPTPEPEPEPDPGDDDPNDSDDTNDRGNGCYKNKDTGAFKWFESDPELNSSTRNYEKVNDSYCKQDITDNPQTGEIAMFLIWIIALGAGGYSVWYYMKNRKEC